MLNRQIAAVNFEPLKPLFLQSYTAAHVSVPANPSLPPLQFHVRRNPETTELREVLPFSSYNLPDLKAGELAEASKLFSRGKFAESLAAWKSVLLTLTMVIVNNETEAAEVSYELHRGERSLAHFYR